MSPCDFEGRIEKLARCRAIVLQAINHTPGMNYSEIREWIKKQKGFIMEGVGPRCRELYVQGLARRKEVNNRVRVYPVEQFQTVWQNRGERAR